MLLERILLYGLTLGVLVLFQACCGMTEKEILLECCSTWDCAQNDNFNPPWTSATDPCLDAWYGITCVNQAVTHIHLNESGLRGSIPASLGNLTNLGQLHLDTNSLTGQIPISLGNLSKLEELHLYRNSLTGPVPSSLANLRHVQILYVALNSLTGTIPSSFANLSNLRGLGLGTNSLTGTIPSLGNLSNLVFLGLDANSLTGPIPALLDNLSSLGVLDLRKNRLTGQIPSLGNLSNLEYLTLDDNSLTGPMPVSLSNLGHLKLLNLSYNHIIGSIPAWLGNMTSLTTIDLSHNNLEGTIPNILPYLSNIKSIFLSTNQLGGSFPFESLSPTITRLMIGDNQFTGNINAMPIGDLTNLTTLDISFNNFRGLIPTLLLKKAPSLTNFVIGFNCFQGSLSEAICSCKQLKVFSAPGLTSGKSCKKPIWKGSATFPAFTVDFLDGALPQCFFGMPNITDFIISGNGLPGKIPSSKISPSLETLDVSNNKLKGVLHENLLEGSLSNIDVSVNYLAGSMGAFQKLHGERNMSNMIVKTYLNRLSGALPTTLLDLKEGNIDVLEGNVFTCEVNIPSNDPYAKQYSCGSIQYDNSMYLFVAITGASILVLVIIRMIEPDFWILYEKKIRQWYEWGIDPASIPKVKEWVQSIHDLAAAQQLPGQKQSIIVGERFRKFQDKLLKQIDTNTVLGNIKRYMVGIAVLQTLSIWLGITIFSMIILYLILWNTTSYESRLDTPYAWVTTSVYLSGEYAVGMLCAALLLLLCQVYVLAFASHYYQPQVLNVQSKEGDEAIEVEEEEEVDNVVQLKSYLRLFIILVLNIVIVGAINFNYTEIVDQGNVEKQQLASFGVALFKVFWSVHGFKYLLRSKHLFFGLDEEEANTSVVTIFHSVPSFVTFLNVMNNLLLPILAFSLFGKKCFLYAFIEQPESSYEYSLPTCLIFNLDGSCYEPSIQRIHVPYHKPFVYQYQCSSAIIEAYSNVYILKFCSEVAWSILLQAYILYVHRTEKRQEDVVSSIGGDTNAVHYDNDNSTGNRNDDVGEVGETSETVVKDGSVDRNTNAVKTTWEGLVLWFKGTSLLVFYRNGMSLDDIPKVRLFGKGCRMGYMGHDDDSSRNKDVKLFDPVLFSARAVGSLAIMLTFGPFTPVIGLVVGIALFVRIAGMRVLVGRGLEELSSAQNTSDNEGIPTTSMLRQRKKVLSKVDRQIQHQGELLHNLNLTIKNMPLSLLWENHRFIIYLSAFWYACVIIDMYAIDVEFDKAMAPALVLLCFPLLLECVGYLFRHWYAPTTKSAAGNSNKDDRSTIQAADTRTSRISSVIGVNPMHSRTTYDDVIPPSSDANDAKEDNSYEL